MRKIRYSSEIFFRVLFLSIIILIILSISLRIYKNYSIDKRTFNLKKDGICVIHNLLSQEDINICKSFIIDKNDLQIKNYIINSPVIQKKVFELIGDDYVFNDYIFLIKKSQIHTCHRDYNGSFFNEKQQYPSYTFLIYLENMDKCLDVIPNTHKNQYNNIINITDNTETVFCKSGDAILFDANLIHTGTINSKEDNMRIQLKLTHKDDLETLSFYQNYNKTLNKDNTLPQILKYTQKHLSCQFPIISNLMQPYDNKILPYNTSSFIDKLFGHLLYGDSQFFVLDNIS